MKIIYMTHANLPRPIQKVHGRSRSTATPILECRLDQAPGRSGPRPLHHLHRHHLNFKRFLCCANTVYTTY